MNRTIFVSALFAAFAITACDKPTVVNVPATTTPGPPGATGSTGMPGTPGTPGAPGKPGEGTTVIVTPPASAASN